VVSIKGTDYYHMVMGAEADGFIQEVYIPLGYKLEDEGNHPFPQNSPVTNSYAVNQYYLCGNQTSCTLWGTPSAGDSRVEAGGTIGVIREAGNARYPLTAPDGKDSGNGTGNPNKVLIRQKMTSGDFTSEFLKDSFTQKPKITQTILDPEIHMQVILDMTNSNYSTSLRGNMTNKVTFLAGSQDFRESANFDYTADAQPGKTNLTAGQYIYTAGGGPGGSRGAYTYAEGGFDGKSLDWSSFFDHSQANPWSFSENRPKP
jgi:hypothetical protein